MENKFFSDPNSETEHYLNPNGIILEEKDDYIKTKAPRILSETHMLISLCDWRAVVWYIESRKLYIDDKFSYDWTWSERPNIEECWVHKDHFNFSLLDLAEKIYLGYSSPSTAGSPIFSLNIEANPHKNYSEDSLNSLNYLRLKVQQINCLLNYPQEDSEQK